MITSLQRQNRWIVLDRVLRVGHVVSQWVFGALIGSVLTYLAIMVGHSAIDAPVSHRHISKAVAECPEEDSCDYSGILNRWVPVAH